LVSTRPGTDPARNTIEFYTAMHHRDMFRPVMASTERALTHSGQDYKMEKNFELFIIVLSTNSPSFDVKSQSVDVLLQTSLGFLPKVVAFIWLLCGVRQVLCGRRRIRQVAVPQWRTLLLKQDLTCRRIMLTTAPVAASETSGLTRQASCRPWRLTYDGPRILTKHDEPCILDVFHHP